MGELTIFLKCESSQSTFINNLLFVFLRTGRQVSTHFEDENF